MAQIFPPTHTTTGRFPWSLFNPTLNEVTENGKNYTKSFKDKTEI